MVGLNVRFRVRFFTLKNQSEKKSYNKKRPLHKKTSKKSTELLGTVAQKKNTYFKTFTVCPYICNTLLNVK